MNLCPPGPGKTFRNRPSFLPIRARAPVPKMIVPAPPSSRALFRQAANIFRNRDGFRLCWRRLGGRQVNMSSVLNKSARVADFNGADASSFDA